MARQNTIGHLMLAGMLMLFVLSCFQAKQNAGKPQRVISAYNPYSEMLHPELRIYHKSDEISRLYSRINVDELLFNRANPKGLYQARMLIRYRIYEKPSGKRPIMENEATIKLDSMHKHTYLTSYLRIEKKLQGKYYMQVQVKDLQQGVSVTRDLLLDKSSPYNASNYMLVYANNQRPLFHNIVDSTEEVYLKYRGDALARAYFTYFPKQLPIAPPPFASVTPKMISTENIRGDMHKKLDENPMHFKKEGIYYVQADTSSHKGMLIYNFGPHYPRIKSPRKMLQPLRYLLSSDEYNNMQSRSNLKLAIDNFWLGISQNTQEARQLIRIYYNRVTFANLYFTSLTQGWKTDRGMIYTVFGPPHAVRKGMDYEEWVYGDQKSLENIRFRFNRVENPFSIDHYVLQRKLAYESVWSEAVDTWRNGEVFAY